MVIHNSNCNPEGATLAAAQDQLEVWVRVRVRVRDRVMPAAARDQLEV